jgi:hypothetical protein
MRPHRSLEPAANVDELVERLGRLEPGAARKWGKMTPHEMLCHLADSFLTMLGERQASPVETWWSRNVIKWVALHTSIPWPQGIPTRPEIDPHRGGTRPADFERDRARVIELLRRFVQPASRYSRHPAFGVMTRRECLLWGYGHVDHHLRQFGC